MSNRELYGTLKRCYETPLAEEIRLEHQTQLLNASKKGNVQNYSLHDYYEE